MKLFNNSVVFQMRVNFSQIKAARKQIAALSVEHPTLSWQKLAFSWKVRQLLNNFNERINYNESKKIFYYRN